MSGRKQWSKRAATSSFLDKKPPKSLVQQGLEGSTAVGKDEVGGSNPPSSSKKSCFLSKAGLFLYFLTNLICGSGWQRRPEDVFHCPPKIVWPTRSCCLIFVSNLASTITQQQKKSAFCRGSDPCHLDETTGGELLYSPEHPLRFLHLTHILTHTGNLP